MTKKKGTKKAKQIQEGNPNVVAPGQNPNARAPGQNPNARAPGQNPNARAPGQNPNARAPGQNPNARAPGQNPVGMRPGMSPQMPGVPYGGAMQGQLTPAQRYYMQRMRQQQQQGGGAQVAQPPQGQPPRSKIQYETSDGFEEWFSGLSRSVAITTYQAGALIVLQNDAENDKQLKLVNRMIPRCMGIAVDQNEMYISSNSEIWKYMQISHDDIDEMRDYLRANEEQEQENRNLEQEQENRNLEQEQENRNLEQEQGSEEVDSEEQEVAVEDDVSETSVVDDSPMRPFDTIWAPRSSYITGNIDAHDMGLDKNGDLIFVNTRCNCLAKLSKNLENNFEPVWVPPFFKGMMIGDRCHLNGLTLNNGELAYATCVAETTELGGWTKQRIKGGVVYDLQTNEVVVRGLSMPHSPRFYNGKLWLTEAGTGHFGFVDLQKGEFERVIFLPGYLRGLTFIDKYALVGSSRFRSKPFHNLVVQEDIITNKLEPMCGFFVIDLETGEQVHYFKFTEFVQELFDVVTFPEAMKNPFVVSFINNNIDQFLKFSTQLP